MTYKYKYVGQGEKHLPTLLKTVYEGEIFETETPINNPEFKEVKEEVKVKNKKNK